MRYTTRHERLKFGPEGGEILDQETGEIITLPLDEYLTFVEDEMTPQEREYIGNTMMWKPRFDPFIRRPPLDNEDYEKRLSMFKKWLMRQEFIPQECVVIFALVQEGVEERLQSFSERIKRDQAKKQTRQRA